MDAVRAELAEIGTHVIMGAPGRQHWDGQICGLDLPDRPGFRTWHWLPRRGIYLPPAPGMVTSTPAEWEWWMPCWLELPMPDSCPYDCWWYPAAVCREGRRSRPECWFVPVWNGPLMGPALVDPFAVALLWRDDSGAARRHIGEKKRETTIKQKNAVWGKNTPAPLKLALFGE